MCDRIHFNRLDQRYGMEKPVVARFRSALSEEQRQLREHSSSIFELQKVLAVHSGATPRGTENPLQTLKAIGGGEDSYDYVVDMITDVRAEHGDKIDVLNDKVVVSKIQVKPSS